MHLECRRYHESTKHTVERLRGAPPMNWDQFPTPYREYERVSVIDLPADPPMPAISAWDVLRGHLGPRGAVVGRAWFSQFLFFAASLSAVKVTASGIRYGLRVNPSSGNLHPTEVHFAVSGMPEWEDGLFHYRPRTHAVEQRGKGDFGLPGQATLVLSTIPWREAWKYGDRAYRYCCLDAGHLAECLRLSARAMGYEVSILPAHPSLSDRMGLPDDEWPLLTLAIGASESCGRPFELAAGECLPYPLPSQEVQSVHAASHGTIHPFAAVGPRAGGRTFGETVRSRRSALDFSGGEMSLGQLSALLTLLSGETYLFIHSVSGIAPGVYRFRGGPELELVRSGEQRVAAAGLSLQQDLAGNACVLFSLFSDFSAGYRAAYLEAGATGQRLYVGAEALGLQATGIGAFYDDRVREYCGSPRAEPVYHFAVGHAVPDERLQA